MIRYFVCFLAAPLFIFSQPYLGEAGKTRHRFAQTVFGCEVQSSVGGNSSFINSSGAKESFNVKPFISPRFYISGTHFWGHAEFYFAIPLWQSQLQHKTILYGFSQSDIFGTKIYPWTIQRKKLRPYLGLTVSGLSYTQVNKENGKGLTLVRTKIPLLAGLNYCTGSYHIDFMVSYNFDNKVGYYISEGQKATLSLPPLTLGISLKRWLETTLSAEKNYQDGSTERLYKRLKADKTLSAWFFGLGPSSAFFTKQSSYNQNQFPYMEKPNVVIFPEVSSGYYYEPMAIHFGSAFRYNRASKKAFDLSQKYSRTSLTAEVFKYLFDYQGFNPYLGLCGSIERLKFTQKSPVDSTFTYTKIKGAYGLIFGWDILPDKLQWFTLRTSLRYFPNLNLSIDKGKTVSFNQLEFNFIQVIYYPARAKRLKQTG